MVTAENPYIKGNFFIGGKHCEHCAPSGLTCRASGVLFNGVSIGKIVANVGGIDDGVDLEISGKLETCKIARGLVTQEEGIASLKASLASEEQAVADEAVRVALEEMKDESVEIPSNIWS